MVLFYSTFFFFFFLAELLDNWLWRWVAFLIVFAIMVVVGAVLGLLGFLKVRRIRGPRQTIESVRETRTALTPGHDKPAADAKPLPESRDKHAKPENGASADPSGW